jgi:hypothetical protein
MYIPEMIYHLKVHIHKLEQNDAIHNRNTCQIFNLHALFYRKTAFIKGIVNMGIKLYHILSNQIREVEKMMQFKTQL